MGLGGALFLFLQRAFQVMLLAHSPSFVRSQVQLVLCRVEGTRTSKQLSSERISHEGLEASLQSLFTVALSCRPLPGALRCLEQQRTWGVGREGDRRHLFPEWHQTFVVDLLPRGMSPSLAASKVEATPNSSPRSRTPLTPPHCTSRFACRCSAPTGQTHSGY